VWTKSRLLFEESTDAVGVLGESLTELTSTRDIVLYYQAPPSLFLLFYRKQEKIDNSLKILSVISIVWVDSFYLALSSTTDLLIMSTL
jgi:hypothetical protein